MSQLCPLGITFDANLIEPRAPVIVRPAGDYPVRMESARWVESKTSPGTWFVEMTFVVTRGEHAGAEFIDRLNLMHHNASAKEVAQRTLSAICRATGVAVITDMSALYGKPLIAHVRVRPAGKGADNRDYGESNEIKGYSVDSEDKPSSPFPAFTSSPAPAPAPAFTAPASAPGFVPPGQPPFAQAPAPAAAPAQTPAPTGRVPWAK